mgnify:FL=1
MNEHQTTTRQVILFTVMLSFFVSLIGTVLGLGILGPLFNAGEDVISPFVFNRPRTLERIIEKIIPGETSERILRQDELVVKTVEMASPAVVSVIATKLVPVIEQFYVEPFGDEMPGFRIPQFRQKGTQEKQISAGTGFLVSSDGLIITNKHVVADTEAEYTVLLNNGEKKSAKVLARDALQDIAILKIEGSNFPIVPLGDSSQIKIGQSAIAIGNALGEFSNTVSVGIVSGLHRSIVAGGNRGSEEHLQELIQTDAAINPGNSGGPLLNLRGEVIGINTAMAQGAENIGFALPINKAKRDLENVKQYGKIMYPFLGVRYIIVTKEIAEKEKLGRDYGALLVGKEGESAVVPESPAQKAGLKDRDIVLELNGERIDADHLFASLIEKYNVGAEIRLKVFRDGKEFEIKVTLQEKK